MDDEFDYRPFARLAGPRPRQEAESACADSRLFLATLEQIPALRKSPPRGFALASLCPAWPSEVAAKMKRKRKKNVVPAHAAVKNQTPAESSAATQTSSLRAFPSREKETSGLLGSGGAPESAEFLDAMRAVTPLAAGGREIAPLVRKSRAVISAEPDFAASVEKSMEFALYSSDEYIEGRVAGLDEAALNRLRAGQFSPEAHIDLHGLNAEQAWEALRDFMRQAWFKGLRCVLLVPGRGLNSPQGQGVLRAKLPQWLTQEPFRRVVLAFCTARPHDGGAGGVYVLLRKTRKKGRIQWERLPGDADLYRY